MREVAADRRDVAHADVGEPPHGARDHRRGARHLGRALDLRQRRHRADGERAIGPRGDARILRAQLAQADEPRRPEYAGFHHQHQGGAAGDRPHRGIVGIEQRDGFAQRGRFSKFERGHVATPLTSCAGVTRASIVLRKGWIAGSSPAMTIVKIIGFPSCCRRKRRAHAFGELPFQFLGLGAQHRLAEAAQLAGQRGLDLIADLGASAFLLQPGQRASR